MNTKSSKKIVPATVFAAIIVLLAFSVMSTTVAMQGNELVTKLTPEKGHLGDVVKVTIDVNVDDVTQRVNVVDTLPAEFTYIDGTFTVSGIQEATPTVDKQVISYTIVDPSVAHTIEFNVKVTEAYGEDQNVKNVVVGTWYDVDDVSIGTRTATADFTILPFKELWKKADGPLTIYEKTETQWKLVISVKNPFPYIMKNTVITDRFGAEIEIDDADITTKEIDEVSITHGEWGYTTNGNSEKVFLTWEIGDLPVDATATLTLLVSTDYNPGKNDKYPDGHQEYSSPSPLDDPYEMNSGATLKFNDPDQDMMQLSAVTDSIYVTVLEKPGKIQKTAKKYVQPGETVEFTIRFTNTGDRPLKMMEVKETMQTGMKYVERSCSLVKDDIAVEMPATKSEGPETIMWTAMADKDKILEIASGDSAVFTLKAKIDMSAPPGPIVNRVAVTLKPLEGGVGFTHTAKAVVTVR